MVSRREFGMAALGALALPRALMAAIDSKVKGVRFGVQTYSFRDLPRPEGGDMVDVIVKAMTEDGLGECELWSPQVEPVSSPAGGGRAAADSPEAARARAALRTWRLETPLDHFRALRK